MARVKLEFPEPGIFSTELEVRSDSINYGGHVGNDKYLTLAQEARIRLFRALGYKNEADMENNTGVILSDAAINYRSQLYLGNQLRIEISIVDQNKYGFDFYYRITNMDNGKIAAIIKTGVVGFNYDKNKIGGFPEEFFLKVNTLNQ
jgi:acyl-CoA thioester hydrolase